MSVINKKPLINTILDGLSSSELSSLKACINGQGPAPIFRSLKPISNAHLTTSDYGVKPIKLELAIPLGGMSVYEGYLIYNASMCYVICYAGEADQLLTILQIDVNNNKAQIVNGSLSILGLRSELDDATEAADGEVTQAEMEAYVPQAIQADKDILSQIELSYSSLADGTIFQTIFTFPEGVMPIKFYLIAGVLDDGYVYCNYDDGFLLDDDGNTVGDCYFDDQNAIIYISGEITDYTISGLLFIYFNNNDGDSYPNWYAILNPSGGTQLYQHHLQDSDGFNWLDVILNDSVKLTDTEHYTEILYIGKQLIAGSGYNDAATATLYGVYSIEVGEVFVVKDLSNTEYSFGDLTDTVTEL